jgi:hypothetical protein
VIIFSRTPTDLFRPRQGLSSDCAVHYRTKIVSAQRLAQQSVAHETREPFEAFPHVSGSDRKIDPCSWAQSKHGLHSLQRTHQTLEGVHIKIAPHFDPPSVRQDIGQPATRLLLRQWSPEGQFHCQELPIGGRALRRLPFHRRFFRWRSRVLWLKPRLRQTSLRRIPLFTNSATNCRTTARVRRLRVASCCSPFIHQLKHRTLLIKQMHYSDTYCLAKSV